MRLQGIGALIFAISANAESASWITVDKGTMLAPHTLLAEYWPSPAIGIGVARPRFSWTMPTTNYGLESTAYQISVVDTAGNITWDSGKVDGNESNQVACGVDLEPDTRYILSFYSSLSARLAVTCLVHRRPSLPQHPLLLRSLPLLGTPGLSASGQLRGCRTIQKLLHYTRAYSAPQTGKAQP